MRAALLPGLWLCLLALPSCMATAPEPPPEDTPPLVFHDLEIERAYSLEDPREQAFRDQIGAQAIALCGSRRYEIFATRPAGPELVREDFLYRLYDVQIACPG